MNNTDFYNLLCAHDWLYDYSDDYSVWKRGNEQHAQIMRIVKENPQYSDLYHDFAEYVFTRNSPKPNIEDYTK